MKHIVYSLILLFIKTSLQAQSTSHVQAYIRVGAGGSRAIGESTSSDGSITLAGGTPYQIGGSHWLLTGTIGAGVVIPVGNHFVIQAELNVEQKGSKKQVGRVGPPLNELCDSGFGCMGIPANGQFSSHLTYLTLPVMVGYRFGKITVLAGPYVGYKLDEKIQGTYTYVQSSASEIPISSSIERYKKVDAGFVASVAYAISPRFGVDLRYSQGMRYVAKPQYRYYYEQYTEPFYNQSAQVGVTYALTRN